jgi:hypothetical protein
VVTYKNCCSSFFTVYHLKLLRCCCCGSLILIRFDSKLKSSWSFFIGNATLNILFIFNKRGLCLRLKASRNKDVIFFLLQLVLFQMKMFNLHIKCHGLCSCSLFALFAAAK